MSDTAQPARPAAESVFASTADQLAAAASAFKVRLGQAEPGDGLDPGLRRDDGGSGIPNPRPLPGQASQDDEGSEIPDRVRDDEEIDASEAAEGAEDGAESRDEGNGEEEAAGEAQPSEIPLPTSWPAERAELWRALPPEAQAVIAEREGQRDAAVNAKFREAADSRKAAEEKAAAEIEEANLNRRRYAEAADQVLSLVVPQMPPRSMLDRSSGDYDPDAYHYRKAVFEETTAFLAQHKAQLGEVRAQERKLRFEAIDKATRDAFLASVPDIADPERATAIYRELTDYGVSLGAPTETFAAPTTALEWHVLWKAREYDRLQEAKAKVASDPKPQPRKAQPAVRPGVATPRGAIEQQQRGKALDRLRKEGSVDAGAAALKHLLKGNLS